MTDKLLKFTSLNPMVLADKRRITLELRVENLPNPLLNINLTMPDMLDKTPPKPQKPDPEAPSPYPNVELSILNSQRQQVALLFIVEHKEPYTSLTIHLRQPDVTEQYTARAEMTYQDQTLDVIESPFKLNQAD